MSSDSQTGRSQLSLAPRSSQPLAVASRASEHVYLGHTAPDLIDVGQLVNARKTHIYALAKTIPEGPSREAFYQKNDLLRFQEFREAVRNAARWKRELYRAGTLRDVVHTIALDAFLQRWFNEDRHTPDPNGWVQYLVDVTPAFAEQIAGLSRHALFPEPVRREHTLITAASGQGKSELLKALIHHYVAHDSAAVVFIDPHGDTAPQVAQWPEFCGSGRLVYVEPGLAPGKTVGLNPLDATGLDADGIAIFADQLGTAIGELSSDLTGNMEIIATGCVRILLEDGNATLFDLLDLLETPPRRGERREENPTRARLVARGREHPDPAMQRFFSGRLEADSLRSAREGIDNRIFRHLLRPGFQAMTCGRSTIHLQSLIEQKKVVIFNLAPLGLAAAAAMGRLIVALVAGIGHRREGTPMLSRVPCHLFVDEANLMASPAFKRILLELRKFGIHLTMAQQVEGVDFDAVGQKAIANSTATKFVGTNLKSALRPVFGDQEPPASEPLRKGQFWVRWGRDGTPTRLQVRSDFAAPDSRTPPVYRMTPQEWELERLRQLKTFYRDVNERPAALPPPTSGKITPAPKPKPPPLPL